MAILELLAVLSWLLLTIKRLGYFFLSPTAIVYTVIVLCAAEGSCFPIAFLIFARSVVLLNVREKEGAITFATVFD